jgi:hypothetical protein
MWSLNLSRRLLEFILPVPRPLPVGPGNAQREHGLGVVGRPPGAGALEALLHHMAVRAFDLAGADGKALREGALVVEMIEAVAQVAMTGPYRASASGMLAGSSASLNAAKTTALLLFFMRFF